MQKPIQLLKPDIMEGFIFGIHPAGIVQAETISMLIGKIVNKKAESLYPIIKECSILWIIGTMDQSPTMHAIVDLSKQLNLTTIGQHHHFLISMLLLHTSKPMNPVYFARAL